ncbi:hypothetical protein [Stenotrophomonas sp. BIGb0135]|uniref:hypothetical protein n=1 Tax=Stenotrophomonas sp. BIGb0135 TaxID=2940620 RepID=UPI0021675835|nr:hypothetical protein [Stenotrophomonas sp. BIGb0135]
MSATSRYWNAPLDRFTSSASRLAEDTGTERSHSPWTTRRGASRSRRTWASTASRRLAHAAATASVTLRYE